MFSTFIRLGAALSCAAMLCSCGGNSVAETQQSTPEGLYTGQLQTTFTGPNVNPDITTSPPANCTENVVTFAVATGSIYNFYPSTNNPAVLNAADEGTLSFASDAMSSSILEVIAPASVPFTATASQPTNPYASIASNFSPMCDNFTNNLAAANLTGGYNTGVNLALVLTYSETDAAGWNNTTQTTATTLLYDADYQGVQSLSTLAGTFNGYVSTSQFSEPASFTIDPASVPANAGNDLGVSVLIGTGASGCSYTGSVSPLFKGNGYSITISTGPSPCSLPQAQFSGLIYLNTSTNTLYSFAPNAGHTDGIIFSGTRVTGTSTTSN